MIRTIIASAAVFILSLTPLSGASAQEQVSLVPLDDALYEITGGRGARGGAYITKDAVLVIDTKMDRESVEQTLALIRERTGAPIRYLINTHSDGDHVTGNRYFPESAVIIAHENCRSEFLHPERDGSPSGWNDPALAPFLPELTFTGKMTLHIGDETVELHHFGTGHTTGDIVVYFPAREIAFIGDQVRFAGPEYIHSYKGGNSFGHAANLERMLDALPVDTFCYGHGEPVNRSQVRSRIRDMRERHSRVRELMSAGTSLDEAKKSFAENEQTLVETIWLEIAEGRDTVE